MKERELGFVSSSKDGGIKKFAQVHQKLKKLGYDSTAGGGKIKYDYVSLGKFKDVADPIIEQEGLVYTQPLVVVDGKSALETIIVDVETGEVVIDSKVILEPATSNPQDLGKVITYCRRYSLFSIFGIVGDKDDDCYMSIEEIKERVKDSPNLQELNRLYKSLRSEQKDEHKSLFTERKRELQEIEEKEKDEILDNTKIK